MKIVRPKAEIKAVLSCLLSPSKVKVELLGKLSPEHFGYRPMHGAYRVVESMLVKSALDLPSMETFLEHPDLEQETADLLKSPTVSPIQKIDDAKRLFETLEHYRVIRRFYRFGQESLGKLKQEQSVDVDKLMGDMEVCLSDMRSDVNEAKLYHVGKGTEDDAEPDELVREVFSNDPVKLLPSTFSNFDLKTGGFGTTDLFIPASHKKGGKSILTLNMTSNMYRLNNVNVIYIPLEMNKQETAERLMSHLSGVEHTKIRTKTTGSMEITAMQKAWRRFKAHGLKNNCRFTVWPASHVTIPQLRIKLKPFKYNVIVIDYINLLDHPNQDKMQDWQKLNDLARDLKLLTKDLNALIIAPTQMNEDGTLRYARGLAEHANSVWTWKYGEEEQGTHIITVDQPAVRGWAPFKFQLLEDFSRMTITDHHGGDPDVDKSTKTKVDSMKGMR